MQDRSQGPDKPFWRSNYYVLAGLGILVLVAVQSLIWAPQQIERPYSQFKRQVVIGTVSDVKIGEHRIAAKWNKDGEEVVFHTPRHGLLFDQSLYALLESNNIEYRGDTAPSRANEQDGRLTKRSGGS